MADAGLVHEVASDMLTDAVESGDLPPEIGGMLQAIVPGMDSVRLEALMSDAMLARGYVETGEMEKARAIVGGYRAMAEQSGLGPLFDSLFAGMLSDQES